MILDTMILYEDNHLIAVNKQAGDIVQIDETGDEPLDEKVKKYIVKKYNKPNGAFLGVIHRLDRPVSGLILFAKTSKGLERMNHVFKQRQLTKTYYAIVKKRPKLMEGNLIHWLVKNKETNISSAYPSQVPQSMRAELSYRVVCENDGYFLIEIDPLTGRPHQIRVQLATLGCPIVGDQKYGSSENLHKRVSLHAYKLEFIHPIKNEKIVISAPLPKDALWEKFLKFFPL